MRTSNSSAVLGILPVLRVLGLLLILFSVTYLMPIACSLIYRDGRHWDFGLAMACNFVLGFFLWALTRRSKRDIRPRDGFLLVTLSWVMMAVTAALPLMLTIQGLSFTDAMFEAMSGLTTSGATVLKGLDTLAPSINLWRHELVWLGGMGIIVLAVAILPLLGVGGMQLHKAETPGPIKDDKLAPRITQTAKSLWLVYAGLTAICMLSYRVAGMNWFDAVCHSFSTMGLGAFSTHDASFGYFHSPTIEMVGMVFMILAAMNFATHFLAWRQGSLRAYLRDAEAMALLAVLAVACLGVTLFIWHAGTYHSFWTSLRHVSFNLVSMATNSGYFSVDYNRWPIFAPVMFLTLACVCASSGSTGGGIKMIRSLILFKQSDKEMFSLLHPSALRVVKVGGRVIPTKVVMSVLGFIHLYAISVVGLTFILLASGMDFITAFSAIIACVNNAGPGLNLVGTASTYQSLSDFQTWVCTFAMLLGRLEVFTVFLVFTPTFWRA